MRSSCTHAFFVDSDKMIDSIEKFEIEQWVSNFSNSATAVESFYNPKLDLDLTKFKVTLFEHFATCAKFFFFKKKK